MSFKRFLICSSGSHPVLQSRTNYAILKEGIMANIHVKLCGIWTNGSGGNVIKRHVLSRALAAPLFGEEEPFM